VKPVVVDTNIWVFHWRQPNRLLMEMVADGEIWTHPIVIGELSMGTLRQREQTLWDLTRLGRPPLATDAETRQMVEARRFWGRGIGWNDAKILASVVIGGCLLWTRDSRLDEMAEEMKVAWRG
jgi:predicted nucleic acid-binding protein